MATVEPSERTTDAGFSSGVDPWATGTSASSTDRTLGGATPATLAFAVATACRCGVELPPSSCDACPTSGSGADDSFAPIEPQATSAIGNDGRIQFNRRRMTTSSHVLRCEVPHTPC